MAIGDATHSAFPFVTKDGNPVRGLSQLDYVAIVAMHALISRNGYSSNISELAYGIAHDMMEWGQPDEKPSKPKR